MNKTIKKFSFGKNWESFLGTLNEDRIKEAEHSLQSMLHLDTLKGKSFLDIGSGSGLFSLAAARLGADKILSFDYDDQSVACTRELKQRFFKNLQLGQLNKVRLLIKNIFKILANMM